MSDPFGAPLPQQYSYSQPSTSQPGPYGNAWGWFDQSAHSASAFAAPLQQTRGVGGLNDEEDLPILEELGIDLGAICRKSKSILIGRVGADSLKDIDMGGPLLLVLCLASLHLLSGKLHMGVILGWSAVSATIFWFIIHQLAGDCHQENKQCIDLYNCAACLGYCLLPMVVTNTLALLLPHSVVIYVLFVLSSMYCAYLAGKLVTKRAPFLEDQLYTVAYPAFLYYATLALISLY